MPGGFAHAACKGTPLLMPKRTDAPEIAFQVTSSFSSHRKQHITQNKPTDYYACKVKQDTSASSCGIRVWVFLLALSLSGLLEIVRL